MQMQGEKLVLQTKNTSSDRNRSQVSAGKHSSKKEIAKRIQGIQAKGQRSQIHKNKQILQKMNKTQSNAFIDSMMSIPRIKKDDIKTPAQQLNKQLKNNLTEMNSTIRTNGEVKIRVEFPESHQEIISNANFTSDHFNNQLRSYNNSSGQNAQQSNRSKNMATLKVERFINNDDSQVHTAVLKKGKKNLDEDNTFNSRTITNPKIQEIHHIDERSDNSHNDFSLDRDSYGPNTQWVASQAILREELKNYDSDKNNEKLDNYLDQQSKDIGIANGTKGQKMKEKSKFSRLKMKKMISNSSFGSNSKDSDCEEDVDTDSLENDSPLTLNREPHKDIQKKQKKLQKQGSMKIQRKEYILAQQQISTETFKLQSIKEEQTQIESKKLINNQEFFENPSSFIPMEKKRSPIHVKKKITTYTKKLNKMGDTRSQLKIALDQGKISHTEIQGIVQRFQEYEAQHVINKEFGIPQDSLTQIKARNVITDRTSLEFNKQTKKVNNVLRTTSNSLLKNMSKEMNTNTKIDPEDHKRSKLDLNGPDFLRTTQGSNIVFNDSSYSYRGTGMNSNFQIGLPLNQTLADMSVRNNMLKTIRQAQNFNSTPQPQSFIKSIQKGQVLLHNEPSATFIGFDGYFGGKEQKMPPTHQSKQFNATMRSKKSLNFSKNQTSQNKKYPMPIQYLSPPSTSRKVLLQFHNQFGKQKKNMFRSPSNLHQDKFKTLSSIVSPIRSERKHVSKPKKEEQVQNASAPIKKKSHKDNTFKNSFLNHALFPPISPRQPVQNQTTGPIISFDVNQCKPLYYTSDRTRR